MISFTVSDSLSGETTSLSGETTSLSGEATTFSLAVDGTFTFSRDGSSVLNALP